jgi:DNA-binding MarR family transcriptional regulator
MKNGASTSTELATGNQLDATVGRLLGKIIQTMPDADLSALEAHLTLHRANNVYQASLDLLLASFPLSTPRFNLLKVMYQTDPEPLSITQVSGALFVSLPSALRMVGILETEGWVQTTRSEADRRVTYVRFSDDGRDRFEKLLPATVEIWEDLWAGLTEAERVTLSHLLAKLRQDLLKRYIGEEGLIAFRASRPMPPQAAAAPAD